jgi:UDP-N-acetylmuramyl pentapeptide phosphotransferase/UDP-N-acetylglucosamine-1-phosphate transferase/glycosyltransferase involved in cell wall biosynthesis
MLFWKSLRQSTATTPRDIATILMASGVIFLAGLADDVRGLSSRLKLILLVGAALAVCRAGIRIEIFDLANVFQKRLSWLSWPITVFWIVGVTVAMNFIDGLDGLAAGIAAITCCVLAVLAGFYSDPALLALSVALLGSLCGFLIYNAHPARIFMGDCGSLFLGFILATLAVAGSAHSRHFSDIAVVAMTMGVPLLDTASTMFRRGVLHRRSIFSAERGHIHHCLIDLGLEQQHAVMVIHGVTLLCGMGAVATLYLQGWAAKVVGTLAVFTLVILFRRAGSVSLRRLLAAWFRNRALRRLEFHDRHAFEEVQVSLQRVRSFEAWWAEIARAAEMLGFQRVRLPMRRRDGSEYVVQWHRPDSCEVMETSVPLRQRRADGPLRLDVAVRADDSLEVASRRLMLLARLLEEHGLDDLGRREAARGHHRGQRSAWTRPNADSSGTEASTETAIADLSDPDGNGRNGNGNGNGNGHGSDGHSMSIGPAGYIPARPRAATRRIALVHDFLYTYAGAERVLEQILNVYPDADVFSLFDFLPPEQRAFLRDKEVGTSFLQHLPFIKGRHRTFLPIMPLAIEQLDVSAYDVVISSSYVAAKGILTRPDQLHICYCHTPVRFAWDMQNQYLSEAGLTAGVKSLMARVVLHYIRGWDIRSANGVDAFVTNSDYVGRRIRKVYRRNATTIHPPVDVEKFQFQPEKENFYLTVSRMVPYKKIGLIAEAFSHLRDHRLVIIGDGPQMDAIRAVSGPNVEILGYRPFDEMHDYMRRARAFVFAAEEDFGIVPVEAQACGTPVIAFGQGGVTESVVEGQSGLFFHQQTAASIVEAILDFEAMDTWDPYAIRKNAERFNAARFRKQFAALVEAEWAAFNRHRTAQPSMPSLFPNAPWTQDADLAAATDADEMDMDSDMPRPQA